MPVDSPVIRKSCLRRQVLILVLAVLPFLGQGSLVWAKPVFPIILIHGIASSGEVWTSPSGLVSALNEIGWTMGGTFNFELRQTDRLIDIQGPVSPPDIVDPHGDVWIVNFGSGSFDTSSAAAVYLQAKAVSLVIAQVKSLTSASKVILVGHSMGGLAAAAYLIGDPDRNGVPDFYHNRNDVAKLLTLGTPFEGSPAANLAAVGSLIPFIDAANALRDLTLATGGSHRNIFLFGGAETQVSSGFESQDVSCDGHVDQGVLKGIAEYAPSEWPQDVSYFWVIGNTDAVVGGDCVVPQASQQRSFGERKAIDAAHASPCGDLCTETKSIDAIIEGLDEPDDQQHAWPVKSGSFDGFITHQGDSGSSLDTDYFRYTISAPTRINLVFANGLAGDVEVILRDTASPATVFQQTLPVNGSTQADLLLAADSYPRDFYLIVRGFAPTAASGIGEPARACDSHLALLRQPYRVSLFPLPATTLSLTASPATMVPGGTATLRAQVREAGGSAVAGAEVSFSPLLSGLAGCTPRGNACVTSTDASGMAEIRFTTTILGSYTFTANAQTGGSTTTNVRVALADTSASASPNPVAVDLPSTITVTYQPPPPAGTAVTFSTGYPGYFSGGSSPYSPSTVNTDSNGTATIRFASSSVGTANITVDSASAAPRVVPLQIYNPNATVNIQLAVSYVSGDSSSSTYRVEAAVTNLSGQPVAGERVDFTASAGSFCPPGSCSTADDITGSTGIGRANLTVTAAGTITAGATVNSSNAATTFIAQIGAAGGTEIVPVRTFSLGAGGKVFGLAFTPNGTSLIASNYGSDTIAAWNTADWAQRWSVTAQHNRPSEVSVSGDGTQVVVATDRGAEIHSTSTGAWVCDSGLSSTATFLATFAGGSRIFTASSGNTYRANACSTLSLNAAGSFEREGHFDYNATKGYVAGGDANGNVNFWNPTTGTKVKSIAVLNNSNAYDSSWNTNGSRVVAVGKGGTVALINTSGSTSTWTKTSCGVPSMPGWRITAAVWLDSDTKIAVGGDNNGGAGRIEILDATSCASFRYAVTDSRVLELAWNPSTRELAAGTSNGSVYVFRPLTPPDTIAPTISITAPADGAVTNKTSVETRGRVTDNTGISAFTINGNAVVLDGSGNFSTNVSLVEGTNTIEYRAVDPLGNVATLTRSVTLVIDRVPPVISGVGVTPASGMVGTSFTITCSVSDGDAGVASVTASIRDGNSAIVATLPLVQGTGSSYSAVFDSTARAEGGYSVDISAVDSSPQANRRTLSGAAGFTLVAPPQPPVAPTSLRIAAGVELIDLLWTDNSANEDGVQVERKVGTAGGWTILETLPANASTHRDSGLACGIPHVYRVRAFNASGESPYSNEVSATPQCVCAPSIAPASISMDSSGGSGSFSLNGCGSTWTVVSEAEWIEINGGATGTGLGTVSFQVAVNTGAARTGTLRVAALGLTLTINQASARPAAPTWLRTTATSTSTIDLLWDDNSNDEDGFKVERKEGPAGPWTVVATLSAAATFYQDATVDCGTPWAYRVWAFNAAGESDRTNEAAATPECQCAEAINPESLSVGAVGGSGSFAVTACGSWMAVSDASWIEITSGASGTGNGTVGFRVARSNIQNPRTGTISLPELGLVFTVQQAAAPADPGFTSFLRLVNGTVAGQTVDPDHRTVTVAPGAVVSGTLGLRIDSSFGSNAVMALGITPSWGGHATSYTDLGHFSTPASGLIRNISINYTAPATPGTYHVLAAFRGEFNAGQVMSATNWGVGTLVWNNGDDLADWSATRIATANQEGTVLADYLLSGGNVPMWVPATAITIVVESPSVSRPADPTWLRATPSSSTRIDLLWEDNSNNEDGFKIERKEGPAGPWTIIATPSANTTTYQDSGLTCGTTYAYRVWAFNAGGDSGKTNEAGTTPVCGGLE